MFKLQQLHILSYTLLQMMYIFPKKRLRKRILKRYMVYLDRFEINYNYNWYAVNPISTSVQSIMQ